MHRFNIELRNNDRVWETHQTMQEDQTAVRVEVAKFVGQLLTNHAEQIWMDEDWRIDVTDETGLILYVMYLSVTNAAASVPMRR